MLGLVVKQPWATLIALGIKTIETRPSPPNGPMRPDGVRGLPGCSLERGERIAIVAGAQRPSLGLGAIHHQRADPETWWLSRQGKFLVLPLGAVVCTVTVDDALPILTADQSDDAYIDCLAVYDDGVTEWRIDPDDGSESDFLHDPQLLLGDFTPGRWGWMLSDPQPITKRCPRCDGRGFEPSPTGMVRIGAPSCLAYCASGRVPIDPIPCKGRQGVFELPAEVSEVLG